MGAVAHLQDAACAGVIAAGFVLLVRASPLGRLPFKPFSCDVCLSGWASLSWGYTQTLAHGALRLDVWAAQFFGGMAAAQLLLGVLAFLRTAATPPAPPPLPADLPPPPL